MSYFPCICHGEESIASSINILFFILLLFMIHSTHFYQWVALFHASDYKNKLNYLGHFETNKVKREHYLIRQDNTIYTFSKHSVEPNTSMLNSNGINSYSH